MSNCNSEGLSVDDMFTKSSYTYRKLFPFYGITYICMERKSKDNIKTMGVSEDTLYYNKDFILSKTISEFNFINMHEIIHVALRHVYRGKGKDKKLWNIACDLYTNAFLENEINTLCKSIGLSNMLNGPDTEVHISNTTIKLPPDAIYCSTINLETDTVENIYNKLYEQGEQNGYNELSTSFDNKAKTYHFEYRGTKSGMRSSFDNFEVDINCDFTEDLIDDGSSKEISEQRSNAMANRVMTKKQMDKEAGTAVVTSNLEYEVGKFLKSEFNWKRHIQKYCIQLISKDTSFMHPDKRMSYQRAIYPGQSIEESNTVKGIKICIDTSGSISDDEFYYFMGQVKMLLDKYKVKAEVIYWDNKINSCCEFKSYKEFRNLEVSGGGGTDVSVVFDYLKSKKCKVKPILTIIFTDGYFGNQFDTPENKRKFKDTLWIMTKDHSESFKPSFGIKAVPKFK